MDYILLILVVILFINKQYNDLLKKDIYNKNNIENKEKNFNSDYKKTHYYTGLSSKENINNGSFKDINDIEDKKIRKNNHKGLNNIIRDMIKSDNDYFDSNNEKVSNNLNREIKIKNGLKDNNEENYKQDIDNKKNNDSEKTYYKTDLIVNENINNSNFKNINITDIGDNKVRENNHKELDNIIKEIVKSNNNDFDTNNEKVSNNSSGNIEIKKALKENDNEEDDKLDVDIILNDGFNIYNISNNNQQYSLVDICKENKESDEQQESLKENVIENINDKLVDNVEEEIIINDKDILHKENNDNKNIIKEDDINKENSESKNTSAFNNLKNKYKGVNVSVVISGVGVLEGEIVFDFPNIIALKNKDNIIIFIDESKVLSIF